MENATRRAPSYNADIKNCKYPIEWGRFASPEPQQYGNAVHRIQVVVAIAAGITLEELLERTPRALQGRASTGCFRRSQADAARRVAIHLAHELTVLNNSVIARLFRRDHTTICHHLSCGLNHPETDLRNRAFALLHEGERQ